MANMPTIVLIVWRDDILPSEAAILSRAEDPKAEVRLIHFNDYTRCISEVSALFESGRIEQLFCTRGTPPTLRYNLGAVVV